MKNFSGVCQAAGADKPLRAFFIWITNIVTLKCKNLSEASFDIAVFIDVIRAVNEREMNAGNSAQIFICPIP